MTSGSLTGLTLDREVGALTGCFAQVRQGTISLPPLLRAVYEAGYRGPYVLEIFSRDVPDSLWETDLDRVIADSRRGLDEAWRAAFPPGA